MELLVVVFLLQLVIAPLYLVFSGSRKMMMTARELSKAVSFGSSLVAGLRKIDSRSLVELPMTPESALNGPLALETLGLSRVPEGFGRFLTLRRLDAAGQQGGPFFEAVVEIRWKNPNPGNSGELKLTVRGLVGE
jgi:hypothetical protein